MLCAFEIDPVNLISLTAFLMQGEETPDRVERIISKQTRPPTQIFKEATKNGSQGKNQDKIKGL